MNSLERMKIFRYSKIEKERTEALHEEIVFLLIQHSNKTESYQKAIADVQVWLQTLVREDFSKRDYISKIAESAGREFLNKVESAKRNAFPFRVSVRQE